jgi:arylsulfatase A-like enzyme
MNRGLVLGGVLVVVTVVAVLLPRSGGENRPPDVLLVTVDTLRADALSPYGADAVTPNSTRLAEQGVVYLSATTPMPITRPGHCSILTGLYPDQHGVLNNRHVLSEEIATLAEMLRNAGYSTAGFTGVRFLNRPSGIAQGFDDFDAPEEETERRAKNVVDRAVEWLEGADPEVPILLWVHVFDPHMPYDPPQEIRRGTDPTLEHSISKISWRTLNLVAERNAGDVPEDVLAVALEYYRGEAEYTDQCLGRLLTTFDRVRDRRRSLVVLTSDHGECFENGIYFEHSDCLYEGALRVPLIVRYPNGKDAGLKVERRVSNVDITPTVLREVALEAPENLAGIPLQDDLDQSNRPGVLVRMLVKRNPDRPPGRIQVIRSVAGEPVAPAIDLLTRGMVDTSWKYLWSPDSEQLFFLPDEEHNLAASEKKRRDQMSQALEHETRRYPTVEAAFEDMNPATIEALEALGYVQ